jgi:hypothetical protein
LYSGFIVVAWFIARVPRASHEQSAGALEGLRGKDGVVAAFREVVPYPSLGSVCTVSVQHGPHLVADVP